MARLVPEPCTGPAQRMKQDKFKILDVPGLLRTDLENSIGALGASVLYIDIDHFGELNARHTERAIDRTLLLEFQTLVADAVHRHGFAYSEGGDEVVILLPNTSIAIAGVFAEELRNRIEDRSFSTEADTERITVSIGVASAAGSPQPLPDWANLAKREAKQQGRNCTVVTSDGSAFHVARSNQTFR
jgi:diguanylate cyclase (GGDEF)-like protein